MVNRNGVSVQNESLVLDLLEWIDNRSRAYQETMDAWGTSCPRLTVWEDAFDARFVAFSFVDGVGQFVHVTESGMAYLKDRRTSSSKGTGESYA